MEYYATIKSSVMKDYFVHYSVNVLNTTKLYILKWLKWLTLLHIFCHNKKDYFISANIIV